jgi:Rps23 Pro-64 3,4-dihydroxylase Tpa1-like proline 4-hydroxylase
MTLVDQQLLLQRAEANQQGYLQATPFPHIILEDLFPKALLKSLLNAFPEEQDSEHWRKIHVKHPAGDMQLGKLGLSMDSAIPLPLRRFIWQLYDAPFLQFLQTLTGIPNLIPDPRLRGGGLHSVLPGGLLGVHADFTRHGMYGIDRRINLLLFLNEDWNDSFGGHLELWSRDVSRCEKKIRPQFGRCVIFNTDTDSYHGHPEPLDCPDGRTRKSIALYYYTNGREDREVEPTSATDWQVLPEGSRPHPG